MSAKRRKNIPNVDPDFLEKQKASLARVHKTVIYFNDKEKAAIEEYCRRFKISSKSSMCRQAIMERVLEALSENHPTLF